MIPTLPTLTSALLALGLATCLSVDVLVSFGNGVSPILEVSKFFNLTAVAVELSVQKSGDSTRRYQALDATASRTDKLIFEANLRHALTYSYVTADAQRGAQD
jgi:hypothetical protein